MYTKQDSIFWWNLEQHSKTDRFHKLSLVKKGLIEKYFRITYYGLMQYQLYKGRQMQSIELSSMDQIIEYISNHFDILSNTFLKDSKFKKISSKEKQDFLKLLEEFILPYINDYSFEQLDEFRITNENILGFIMQLAIKNQFNINILEDDEQEPVNPFYSEIYPFMVTLMIINPTEPAKIYENVKNFFNPEMLKEYYQNGRTLSQEEIDVLIPQMDLLENDEDYNYFLFNFNEENWTKSDLQTRFKLVFQLSKMTAILLKENIYSLTFLENESDLYDLIEFYLPIILRSEAEMQEYQNDEQAYYFEKKLHPHIQFLRPWSIKDFDPRSIEKYYQKLKVYDVQFELDKLYKMMDISLYASSYIRLLTLLGNDSPSLQKVLIDDKQLALVNTLKIFKLHNGKYVQQQKYDFRLNDVFLDLITLKKMELFKFSPLKNASIVIRFNSILKLLSYMLALSPSRVKEFGYSLDEWVRYYLILYGPYKKTRIGYQTNDFFLLTKKIIEIVSAFKNKYVTLETNEKELIKSGYYLHIYLIEKLLEFSKNED